MSKEIESTSKFYAGRYRLNGDGTVAEETYLRMNVYTGGWDIAMGKNDAEPFDTQDDALEFVNTVSEAAGKLNKTPYRYFIREEATTLSEVYETETIPKNSEESTE